MATDTYDAYYTYSFKKLAIASPLFILKNTLDTQSWACAYHIHMLSEIRLEPKLLTSTYISYIRCMQLYTWYIYVALLYTQECDGDTSQACSFSLYTKGRRLYFAGVLNCMSIFFILLLHTEVKVGVRDWCVCWFQYTFSIFVAGCIFVEHTVANFRHVLIIL